MRVLAEGQAGGCSRCRPNAVPPLRASSACRSYVHAPLSAIRGLGARQAFRILGTPSMRQLAHPRCTTGTSRPSRRRRSRLRPRCQHLRRGRACMTRAGRNRIYSSDRVAKTIHFMCWRMAHLKYVVFLVRCVTPARIDSLPSASLCGVCRERVPVRCAMVFALSFLWRAHRGRVFFARARERRRGAERARAWACPEPRGREP